MTSEDRAVAILKAEGVVLRTIEFSETSLIVWLFTREHGRVHVLAKGARRPRSPFEGALEPLVRCELVFYRRPRAELDTAKEVDPLDAHAGLRRDLARLHRGLYLAELLTELSERDCPAPAAYDALCEALRALARGDARDLDRALFTCELKVLASAGLAPTLDRCARCGAAVADAPGGAGGPPSGSGAAPSDVGYAPEAGGVLCLAHGREATGRLSRGALKTLRALASGSAPVAVARDVGAEVRRALDAFLVQHLGRPLRLARYVR